MNRKELTKTVMMISNGKNHFDIQGFSEKNSTLQGLVLLGGQRIKSPRSPWVVIIFILTIMSLKLVWMVVVMVIVVVYVIVTIVM